MPLINNVFVLSEQPIPQPRLVMSELIVPKMMPQLPTELLNVIAEKMTSLKDVSSLMMTCKRALVCKVTAECIFDKQVKLHTEIRYILENKGTMNIFDWLAINEKYISITRLLKLTMLANYHDNYMLLYLMDRYKSEYSIDEILGETYYMPESIGDSCRKAIEKEFLQNKTETCQHMFPRGAKKNQLCNIKYQVTNGRKRCARHSDMFNKNEIYKNNK
tara:strand:- start:711 stop:1364 length:654 start_codon:yes stop_codon:yes gene_type:complete